MLKLMIVDDEQIEREGMQVILERAFPQLVIGQAKSGNMAVQMVADFNPDVILMDIKMPGMNGLEAVERITDEYPMIKFIMVTAYDTFDYMRQSIKLGVKDYLLKPSKASDIIATIGKVLKQVEEERKHTLKSRLEKEALQSGFSDKIRLGQWEQIRLDVLKIIHYYKSKEANLLLTQQRVLEVLWMITRVMSEMGIETVSPLFSYQTIDFRQLRSETIQMLDRMMESYVNHYDKLGADTIHQIKQYIFDHSHEDISLDALGEKVGLSPIYISKLFKEKLGINYIDLLTECRIEKAKKLLLDPEKSIKEITFEVGYHDPNYFSKVFKKMCAVSPREYRGTLLGKTKKALEV